MTMELLNGKIILFWSIKIIVMDMLDSYYSNI